MNIDMKILKSITKLNPTIYKMDKWYLSWESKIDLTTKNGSMKFTLLIE